MKTEFMVAITQLSAEKNLTREVVLAAVESALISAYRKDSFSQTRISQLKSTRILVESKYMSKRR